MSPMKRKIPALFLAMAGAMFAASGVGLAQEAYYLSNDASTCEIFRHVSREVPGECRAERPVFRALGMKTRSIVVRRKVEDAVAEAGDKQVAEPVFEAGVSNDFSVALRTQFEFDSVELDAAAKSTLDRVAKVLNHDLLSDKVFLVEGHADSVGSAGYNLDLSKRRAQAVKQYLVRRHGVEASRLVVAGRGESEPYDPERPSAGINRRVEFQNVTDLASLY